MLYKVAQINHPSTSFSLNSIMGNLDFSIKFTILLKMFRLFLESEAKPLKKQFV